MMCDGGQTQKQAAENTNKTTECTPRGENKSCWCRDRRCKMDEVFKERCEVNKAEELYFSFSAKEDETETDGKLTLIFKSLMCFDD